MSHRYDVVVVGLGAVGACAAWQAARRGARVLAVDPHPPGHRHGSSHGGSRIHRLALFEGAEHVPLARRSRRLVDELAAAGDAADLFVRSGGLVVGPPGSARVQRAQAVLAAADEPHEVWDAARLAARYPALDTADPADAEDVAVWEPGAGVLRPERVVVAAAAAATRCGAELALGERCEAVEPGGAGVRVRTTAGLVRAGALVLAGGAWLPRMLVEAGLLAPGSPRVRVQRSVLAWFPARPGTPSARWRAPALPVLVRETADGIAGWGIGDVDGRGVKVGVLGGQGPAAGKRWLDRAEDNAAPVLAAEGRAAAAVVARLLPGLTPSPSELAACMDAYTADRRVLLGPVAGWPGVVVCGGLSGHGFKHAPALGEAAACLALGLDPGLDLAAFDPGRLLGQPGERRQHL